MEVVWSLSSKCFEEEVGSKKRRIRKKGNIPYSTAQQQSSSILLILRESIPASEMW